MRLILVLAVMLCVAGPAAAGTQDAFDCYYGSSITVSAEGCSKVISARSGSSSYEKIAARRKRARLYFDDGQYAKARDDYIVLRAAAAPRNAEDLRMLALSYWWLDQRETALPIYESLRKTTPRNQAVEEEFADLLSQLGRPNESLQVIFGLLATKPFEPYYLLRQGEELLALNRYAEAVKALNKAWVYDRENPRVWRALARAQSGNAQYADAFKSAGKAVNYGVNDPENYTTRAQVAWDGGNLDQAEKDYGKALALQPDPYTYLDRATLRLEQENFVGSEADIKAAELAGIEPSRTLVLRGRVDLAKDRVSKALEKFNRALAVAPNSLSALYWRGTAYSQSQKSSLAIADFEKILATAPSDIGTLLALAEVNCALGRYRVAISQYRDALSLNPSSLYARSQLSSCLADSGKLKQAESEADALLKADPDYALGHYRKARAFRFGPDPQRAFEPLGRYIELTKERPWGYIERARVNIELSRFEQAEKDLAEAEKRAPGDREVRFVRAWLLEASKRVPDAENIYEALVREAPDDGWAYYYRAMIRYRSDRPAAALQDCLRSTELLPDYSRPFLCVSRVMMRLDKRGAAREAIQKAVRVKTDSGEAHYELGAFLYYQSEFDDAIAALSEAIAREFMIPEALTFRGDAYRALSLPGPARSDYRRALRLASKDLTPVIEARLNQLESQSAGTLPDIPSYPQKR